MKRNIKPQSKGIYSNNLKKLKLKAKLSDNKEMLSTGFILGFVTCLIASLIAFAL